MSDRQVFHLIEFCGDGDAFFGGGAADYGLYDQEDGTHAFMPGMEALRRGLVRSYFPTREEAQVAGDASSSRAGLVTVLEKHLDPRIPTGQIGWFVGTLHVGSSDEEVSDEISKRLSKACDGDRDVLSQATAYALACHRANQELVRAYCL
ncbi:hypothetical protein G6L37_01215 [Agrobacterium rubi]|nr:hypothetical protein [Agrobacterium rubi]NTF24011.1 hypothetical protein [Agrobacterium rubi]